MIAQINMRKGTSAEWAAASPVVLLAGEPGWDTTLRGMKVGDGITEWAELPWIDSKNNPTVNRPNILHNADFRAPINQRGVSGTISTGTYFYDRWIRSNGTVTVNSGYLTMESGAVIEQRIEGNLLAGLVCTVSFEVGGTIYHGSGAFPTNNGTASVEVDGYPDITLGCATGYMFVLIPATSETNIKRVKCEMGFVSTLHLDPPMDHAVELLKCQRYFFRLTYWTCGAGIVAGGAARFYHALVYPVKMRITPTMTFTGATMGDVGNCVITSAVGNDGCINEFVTDKTSAGSYLRIETTDGSADL
jgi:hypothetical protein